MSQSNPNVTTDLRVYQDVAAVRGPVDRRDIWRTIVRAVEVGTVPEPATLMFLGNLDGPIVGMTFDTRLAFRAWVRWVGIEGVAFDARSAVGNRQGWLWVLRLDAHVPMADRSLTPQVQEATPVDGSERVACEYGGRCEPGQCPGPCGNDHDRRQAESTWLGADPR